MLPSGQKHRLDKIGSRDWWLAQIKSKPNLEVVEETSYKEAGYELDYINIRATGSRFISSEQFAGLRHSEDFLKEIFYELNPFSRYEDEDVFVEPDLGVKLGRNEGKMDFHGLAIDGSHWSTEFKIVEADRGVGEMKIPIQIGRISEAIGQSLLYCQLLGKKFPSQDRQVMPVICTWLLGSGRDDVIELCRKIGITFFMIDKPDYAPNGKAMRIYYLYDESPRSFCLH
jgi:hypothetical protein